MTKWLGRKYDSGLIVFRSAAGHCSIQHLVQIFIQSYSQNDICNLVWEECNLSGVNESVLHSKLMSVAQHTVNIHYGHFQQTSFPFGAIVLYQYLYFAKSYTLFNTLDSVPWCQSWIFQIGSDACSNFSLMAFFIEW